MHICCASEVAESQCRLLASTGYPNSSAIVIGINAEVFMSDRDGLSVAVVNTVGARNND